MIRHKWYLAIRPVHSLLASFALLLLPFAARAVTLSVTSATVSEPGDRARVCVTLETSGALVAGTQNDLVWDGTCATFVENSCVANPDHGKQLSMALLPGDDFVLRAIVLSLSDVDPIPDGELYCCSFLVEVSRSGECCPLRLTKVGASTPEGLALSTDTSDGFLCVGSGTASGCQLIPAAERGAGLTVLAAIAAVGMMLGRLTRYF